MSLTPPPPTGDERRRQVAAVTAAGNNGRIGARPPAPGVNLLAGAAPSMPSSNMLMAAQPSAAPMGGNALAPAPAGLQQPPAPNPPPAAPMTSPAVQTPLAAPIGSHPADDVHQLRATLARAPIALDKLSKVAAAEDHIIELTGTLLHQTGNITLADLAAALKKAGAGGKVDAQAAATFAARLPPVTDQAALRSALMLQRERSIRGLVALHGAAQDRGTPLLPMQSGTAGAASSMPTQAA